MTINNQNNNENNNTTNNMQDTQNTGRKNTGGKNTEFILDKEIDTPYPYCLIPKRHSRGLAKIPDKNLAARSGKIRTILSVTTWDGRELMKLKSLN